MSVWCRDVAYLIIKPLYDLMVCSRVLQIACDLHR